MQMSILDCWKTTTAWFAIASMLTTPLASRAAEQPIAANHLVPAMKDVALQADGVLKGQVIDAAGQPIGQVTVWVQMNGQWVGTAVTDNAGAFAVTNLRGGVALLLVEDHAAAIRAWSPGTAPPEAAEQALVVSRPNLIRGQRPISDLFLADPVIVGVIVAAAIAIPLSIHKSKQSTPPGS